MPILQMWSGLPRQIRTSAHDWGQVLTFQGKSCSLSRAFTTRRILGLSGYVTQLKFVEGKIPDQLEKRLGLRKGELGNGAIIKGLIKSRRRGILNYEVIHSDQMDEHTNQEKNIHRVQVPRSG